MSAYLVSKKHIDALVYARAKYAPRVLSEKSNDELGRMLWRSNMLSLQALYGERHGNQVDRAALASYVYSEPFPWPNAYVIAKALRCYDYQACEHAAYQRSLSRHFVRELFETVARCILNDTPAYSNCDGWSL